MATAETTTRVLVAYASKHGATRGIAQRIAATLRREGLAVTVLPATPDTDPAGYDAFVIGGAAYLGSWLKETAAFVRRHRALLAARPVWLFSSGPLGTATTDAKGRDVLVASEPKEFAEFRAALAPRDARVFFGALDPGTLGFAERVPRLLPAGRALLPAGDFRDWAAIEAWAAQIARELAPVPASGD